MVWMALMAAVSAHEHLGLLILGNRDGDDDQDDRDHDQQLDERKASTASSWVEHICPLFYDASRPRGVQEVRGLHQRVDGRQTPPEVAQQV